MKINRRRLLAGLCGVAGGTVAGCLQSQSKRPFGTEGTNGPSGGEGPEIPSDAIDITEHGADPTGETSVVPTLNSVAEDGAVLHFPDGEYRFDETWSFSAFETLTLLGPEATIVAPEGFDSYLFYLQSRDAPASLRFEGFSFDLTAPDTGGRVLDAQIGSELVVRDVTVRGTADVGPNTVRVDVVDPDGSGLIERLSLPDGSAADTDISGCYVGNRSFGDIRFADCRIEGFYDNGLYADPPGGRIDVDGGYYANSGISNVRVRANSIVRNVHVRCDSPTDGFENMRGIRLSNFEPISDAQPAVVRNCLVELTDVSGSDGAIVLSDDLNAVEIYDTQIHVDVDSVPALRAKSPSVTPADDPQGMRCENVQITGSSGNQSAVYVVERDSCLFDNVCIHQTGPNQNGVELVRSDNNTIQNSHFDVTGEPVLLQQSTSDVRALRTQPLEGDTASLSGGDCGHSQL